MSTFKEIQERLNHEPCCEHPDTEYGNCFECRNTGCAHPPYAEGQARDDIADLLANPRDAYHTMAELYEYRLLYNAHAAHGWLAAGIPVVKSWYHSDGEACFGGGWFVVVAALPTGQVTNHYEGDDWHLFQVPEVDLAPEWDGHTPIDAARRLREAL